MTNTRTCTAAKTRNSADAEIARHASVEIIHSSVTAQAAWQRHCGRRNFYKQYSLMALDAAELNTFSVYPTGLTRWNSGSHDITIRVGLGLQVSNTPTYPAMW